MPTTSGIKAGGAFVVIEAVDKTARVMGQIENRLKKMSAKIARMGVQLQAIGLGIATPLGIATKAFADFDDAMRKVQARTDDSSGSMQDVRKAVRALATETTFRVDEIGKAMAKLSQRGFGRNQLIMMIGPIIDLAKAAGEGQDNMEDLTNASDAVAGALKQFRVDMDKLDSQQVRDFADIFTTAVNNSNFSLESLKDSLSKIGSVASDMKNDIQPTIAMLSGMTEVNFSAAESGTALRTIFSRLVEEKTNIATFNRGLFKATGRVIEFRDAVTRDLRDPLAILMDIGMATKDMGSAERMSLLANLFSVRQFAKAQAIITGIDQAIKLRDKLTNEAGGKAARTREIMEGGIGGAIQKLISSYDELKIAIGEALSAPVAQGLFLLKKYTTMVASWIKMNQQVVVVVAAIAVGLVAVGTALVGIAGVIWVVAAGFMTIKILLAGIAAILSMILSPIGLILGAFVALGAYVMQTTKAFQTVVDGLGVIGDTARTVVMEIANAFLHGDLLGAWEILTKGLLTLWTQFVDVALTAWHKFSGFFVEAWIGATTVVKNLWLDVQNFAISIILTMTRGLLDFLRSVGGVMKKVPGMEDFAAEGITNIARFQRYLHGLEGTANLTIQQEKVANIRRAGQAMSEREKKFQDAKKGREFRTIKAQEELKDAIEKSRKKQEEFRAERDKRLEQAKINEQKVKNPFESGISTPATASGAGRTGPLQVFRQGSVEFLREVAKLRQRRGGGGEPTKDLQVEQLDQLRAITVNTRDLGELGAV